MGAARGPQTQASMQPRLASRGEPREEGDHGLELGASMQPRLASRGEPEAARARVRGRVRFNAATAREPWRTPLAYLRRYLAAEASMQPRLASRGEQLPLALQG